MKGPPPGRRRSRRPSRGRWQAPTWACAYPQKPRCPKEEGRRSATCLSDRLLGSPSLSWEGGKLNPEPSQPPDGSLRRPSSMPISSDATVSYTHLRAHETDSYLV